MCHDSGELCHEEDSFEIVLELEEINDDNLQERFKLVSNQADRAADSFRSIGYPWLRLALERKLKSPPRGEKCLLTIDLIFLIPSKSNKYPRCAACALSLSLCSVWITL